MVIATVIANTIINNCFINLMMYAEVVLTLGDIELTVLSIKLAAIYQELEENIVNQ